MRKGIDKIDLSGALEKVEFTAANENQELSETEQSGTLDFLAHLMRLEPRASERPILEKLNAQIDEYITLSYGSIDQSIDRFFQKINIDDNSFSQIDALELERTILQIQKTIYSVTEFVSNLYNEAYFSDRIQQDEYWSAYREADLKTKDDKQAYAYHKTKDSRFYYYYRYMIWKRMSEKLSSLKEMQKTLEFFRTRTQKDRYV